MTIRHATITYEVTRDKPWHFEQEEGRASIRFEDAQTAIDWVRNIDKELSRIENERFTVIEWVNVPADFVAPAWKGSR